MAEGNLLHNGTVITAFPGDPAARVIHDGAVAWDGHRIEAVGPRLELEAVYPRAVRLDAGGGIIMPGLVNVHHHFYSALARGLDPGVSMSSFPEILDRLWWRLDRALDAETVTLSARLSLADCVRWGCTTVFDHHASPSCIDGSLDLVAEAVEEAGLSALLCYEITDRNGHDQALAGLDENLRFIKSRVGDTRVRGVVGLHASFTLRTETLESVAVQRPAGTGVHIHLAEDPVDVRATTAAFGIGPVDRLESFGLLDEHCLLAHGIHLEPADYVRIGDRGAVLIHNPESNQNNAVGHLSTVTAARHGCMVGLGTDGMSSAVLRALRSAFLLHRHSTSDCSSGFEALPDLLANNVRAARRFFDEPNLGVLSTGAPADIIAVDAPPPTPLDTENLFAHLVFGVAEAPVRHTIARGRVLLNGFRFTSIDTEELAERARQAAPAMWERFRVLKWGTKYLGE